MSQTKRVALYGRSLFIAALDASLSAVPELEIQRVVEGCGDDALPRVRAWAPDVIILELGAASGNLALTFLRQLPTVTLIGLDPESNRLLVLSAQHPTTLAAADLVRVIQNIGPPVSRHPEDSRWES